VTSVDIWVVREGSPGYVDAGLYRPFENRRLTPPARQYPGGSLETRDHGERCTVNRLNRPAAAGGWLCPPGRSVGRRRIRP
jgi:hypothetical protein